MASSDEGRIAERLKAHFNELGYTLDVSAQRRVTVLSRILIAPLLIAFGLWWVVVIGALILSAIDLAPRLGSVFGYSFVVIWALLIAAFIFEWLYTRRCTSCNRPAKREVLRLKDLEAWPVVRKCACCRTYSYLHEDDRG